MKGGWQMKHASGVMANQNANAAALPVYSQQREPYVVEYDPNYDMDAEEVKRVASEDFYDVEDERDLCDMHYQAKMNMPAPKNPEPQV